MNYVLSIYSNISWTTQLTLFPLPLSDLSSFMLFLFISQSILFLGFLFCLSLLQSFLLPSTSPSAHPHFLLISSHAYLMKPWQEDTMYLYHGEQRRMSQLLTKRIVKLQTDATRPLPLFTPINECHLFRLHNFYTARKTTQNTQPREQKSLLNS